MYRRWMESDRARWLIGAVLASASAGAALGQSWATFKNETSTRLVASSGLGVSDPEEKAYTFGDFDKDGDLDLAVARKTPFTNAGPRPNVLFMNEGVKEGHAIDGVLVDRTSVYCPKFLEATDDRDIECVDLNGDTWLDLVTAPTLGKGKTKEFSHPRIYINLGVDGGGNWLGFTFDDVNRIPTFAGPPAFNSVSFGDVDLDGDMDLYFTDYSSSVNSNSNYSGIPELDDRLLINDGQGYFTDQSSTRMTTQMLNSAFGINAYIRDFNGDERPDIIKDTALFAPQQIQISYNNPANVGFFNQMNIVYSLSPYFVGVGDLNNDGRLDFTASDDGQDRYALNTGNNAQGQAQFTSFSFSYTGGGFDDGFANNAYVVDLNNDGFNDVVIADVDVDIDGCNRRMHIFRNLGNVPNVTLQEQSSGSATCGIPWSSLVGVHDVAVFDINGDGWKDMVLGRCTGTAIWMNVPPAGLQFTYPQGVPAFVTPDQPFNFQVKIAGIGTAQPVAGSGKISVAIENGPFTTTAMTHLGNNLYQATLPAAPCATQIRFYVSGDAVGGAKFNDPPLAPNDWYTAFAAAGTVEERDELEGSVSAWLIQNDPSLTGGAWEHAIPNGTVVPGFVAAPFEDGTAGSGVKCFVTQNGPVGAPANGYDVDFGPTRLISPKVDLTGTDARISFSYWFFCDDKGVTGADFLTVEVSNNDGGSWTKVMDIADSAQDWTVDGFWVSDYVAPSGSVRVRFTTNDTPSNSITEAGIDNFTVTKIVCGACKGDINGDGKVCQEDLGTLLASYGLCEGQPGYIPAANIIKTGGSATCVDQVDLGQLLAEYNACGGSCN